ncbi:DUF5049 domain-containing protein [Lactonifactor sp. BIOML-A4]|uniref:DUF5049 domain-containing protein n=1 Tax=unclassified Lactonifactor TaxID=2636670 RepID=UPI00325A7C5C
MRTAIYCRVGNKEQVIPKKMDEKVKEQILAIRETGLTNMFDIRNVQKIACDMEFWELVFFIDDHEDRYTRFILTGEE